MSQRGFTLLEMLVAMSLFSVLGLGTYQLFDVVVRAEQRIKLHEQQLRELQRALAMFERDLQMAARRALSEDRSGQQALIGQANNLRLSRQGWRNPLGHARSELLEVQYDWGNGTWTREYRVAPQRESQQPPLVVQQLLNDVKLIQLSYIDHNGHPHSHWPIDGSALSLPNAVDIQLDAAGYPGLRRVILLPGEFTVEKVQPDV
ncbi:MULTISPECIES: type II secretion system minor pseudopilin GspJ [Pseudomonas]|jgi:general secretion pathway protein J|uniref:type II secretion system minor pseudopilin GspJ n=1 Tax=Pseudomonas TaxID=286 RepID=UPI00099B5314|nr:MULTISPECIES: type II secretion system minor pseudopilin GspJ [Pseudomonas]MCK3838879.1 type II secretion system protein GspJ [Pseudomonas sp. NCIMB 10586]OPB05916.1 type II secretion system protein GspJ [Pseudomonas synxantha]VCU67850.1 general secretion pathway protein GspJ [Pseudomonas synxantha]